MRLYVLSTICSSTTVGVVLLPRVGGHPYPPPPFSSLPSPALSTQWEPCTLDPRAFGSVNHLTPLLSPTPQRSRVLLLVRQRRPSMCPQRCNRKLPPLKCLAVTGQTHSSDALRFWTHCFVWELRTEVTVRTKKATLIQTVIVEFTLAFPKHIILLIIGLLRTAPCYPLNRALLCSRALGN